MAITSIIACDKDGNAIDRSTMRYKPPYKELSASVSDNFPCFKATCDGSSAETLTIRYWVKDCRNSNTQSTYYNDLTVTVSPGTHVYAIPLTFDKLAAWQSIHHGAGKSPGAAYIVQATAQYLGVSSSPVEQLKFSLSSVDLVDWSDERGWPSFTKTTIDKAHYSGEWIIDDDSTSALLNADIKVPPHFPWCARVLISAWNKPEPGSISTLLTNAPRSQIYGANDIPTERTASGFAPAYNLDGVVKVTYTLQWSPNSDFSSHVYTVDTITLYKSFLSPIIHMTSQNTVEFSDSFAKAIMDVACPINTIILAVDYTELLTRINRLPGTWQVSNAYWEVETTQGTMTYYTATRIA